MALIWFYLTSTQPQCRRSWGHRVSGSMHEAHQEVIPHLQHLTHWSISRSPQPSTSSEGHSSPQHRQKSCGTTFQEKIPNKTTRSVSKASPDTPWYSCSKSHRCPCQRMYKALQRRFIHGKTTQNPSWWSSASQAENHQTSHCLWSPALCSHPHMGHADWRTERWSYQKTGCPKMEENPHPFNPSKQNPRARSHYLEDPEIGATNKPEHPHNPPKSPSFGRPPTIATDDTVRDSGEPTHTYSMTTSGQIPTRAPASFTQDILHIT